MENLCVKKKQMSYKIATFLILQPGLCFCTRIDVFARRWTHELRAAGKRVGCQFASWKIWPNTLLAHCLVEAVHKEAGARRAEEAVEQLSRVCYEEGGNISDVNTLSVLAQRFGVRGDWRSDQMQRNVRDQDRHAKDVCFQQRVFIPLRAFKTPHIQHYLRNFLTSTFSHLKINFIFGKFKLN